MTNPDNTENQLDTDCPDWCNRTHIGGVHAGDLMLSDEGPKGVAIYTRLVDDGHDTPGIEVMVVDLASRQVHKVVAGGAAVAQHFRVQHEMEQELFALIDSLPGGAGQ